MSRAGRYVLPIALVVLALVVRLLFFVGYQGRDDRNYLAYAHFVAAGHGLDQLAVQNQWVGRVGFWLPLSTSIRILGSHEVAYIVWPLLFSLMGILVTLKLGAATVGRPAAALAATLMAVVPLDVLYATKAYPDLPLGVLMTASFWLVIQGRQEGGRPWLLVLAGGLLGLAYLHKETALFALAPIGLILGLHSRERRRACALFGVGVAFILGSELTFWTITKGDPLYRFHAAQSALERVISQQPTAPSWWSIPGPKPTETYRSQNSALDAALMLGMNEEFGLLYWLVIPLAFGLFLRRDVPSAPLRMWLLVLLPLLLFFPVHWPRYTMPRDPRYLTCLTIPAVLLLAYELHRMAPRWRAMIITAFVSTSLGALTLAVESATMEPQRSLVARALTGGQRLWVTPQYAADLLLMDAPLDSVGIHLLEQGRTAASFEAARLVAPNLPVAQDESEIPSGELVLRERRQREAPAGWHLVDTVAGQPSWLNEQAHRLLSALGFSSLAKKLAPGGGGQALIYQRVTPRTMRTKDREERSLSSRAVRMSPAGHRGDLSRAPSPQPDSRPGGL